MMHLLLFYKITVKRTYYVPMHLFNESIIESEKRLVSSVDTNNK